MLIASILISWCACTLAQVTSEPVPDCTTYATAGTTLSKCANCDASKCLAGTCALGYKSFSATSGTCAECEGPQAMSAADNYKIESNESGFKLAEDKGQLLVVVISMDWNHYAQTFKFLGACKNVPFEVSDRTNANDTCRQDFILTLVATDCKWNPVNASDGKKIYSDTVRVSSAVNVSFAGGTTPRYYTKDMIFSVTLNTQVSVNTCVTNADCNYPNGQCSDGGTCTCTDAFEGIKCETARMMSTTAPYMSNQLTSPTQKSLSKGAVAGITIACVAFGLLLISIFVCKPPAKVEVYETVEQGEASGQAGNIQGSEFAHIESGGAEARPKARGGQVAPMPTAPVQSAE